MLGRWRYLVVTGTGTSGSTRDEDSFIEATEGVLKE
jgi:hypothetical protein